VSLTPGTRIGSYEVAAQIGAGGMGEVYRARDTTLDRDVALKLLPDALASDPDRLARFHREAKALASLSHPNIANIYGLEQSAGRPCIVMELLDGETLRHHAGRGDSDRVFEWLEKAREERTTWITVFTKADPRLDPFRHDPRFVALLRRMGLDS